MKSQEIFCYISSIKNLEFIEDKRLKASHDAFRSLLKGSIIRHVHNLLLHEFNTHEGTSPSVSLSCEWDIYQFVELDERIRQDLSNSYSKRAQNCGSNS